MTLTWTRSPTGAQVASSWCWAYCPCSADTELPGLLWSCHGDWKLTCLFNNGGVFFLAILLITLRAFWLDWNFCRHVLYMLSSSLCPSVCLVSLKIAIFPVKPCNCQRTSCVCVYNASTIVFFFLFFFFLSSLSVCEKTNMLWRKRGKDVSITCRDNGTFRLSPQEGFCIPCCQLTNHVIWHSVILWSCVKSKKKKVKVMNYICNCNLSKCSQSGCLLTETCFSFFFFLVVLFHKMSQKTH